MAKNDMSSTCGPGYQQKCVEYENGKISYEEYEGWYMEHCDNCIWMSEICMFGEEPYEI